MDGWLKLLQFSCLQKLKNVQNTTLCPSVTRSIFCTTSKQFKHNFPLLIRILTLILNFNISCIEISTSSLWFLNSDSAQLLPAGLVAQGNGLLLNRIMCRRSLVSLKCQLQCFIFSLLEVHADIFPSRKYLF